MKSKKILCLLLSVCLVIFSSCTIKKDEGITGDVKEKDGAVSVDEADEEKTAEHQDMAEKTDKTETSSEQEQKEISLEEQALALGCQLSDGGMYYDDAVSLCEAVKNGDKEKIAVYTDGKAEYYSFLDGIEIASYTLYPMTVSDDVIAEMDKNGKYFRGFDMYLADFDVTVGDGEYFKEGHNLYYIGLGFDAVAGGLLRAFVPAESAEEHMYYDSVRGDDKIQTIIKEFISLYPNEIYGTRLYDGKNYPEDFDFSNHVHLVTHLMARNGIFGGEPPYTLDEINTFLSTLFNGNEGIVPDGENWSLGIRYGVTEEDEAEGRIYGCSWAHGGTSVEHSILGVQDDDGRKVYTVQIYADYSRFAKSRLIEITFENAENDIPNMMLVNVIENTGNNSAYVSI